MRNILLTALSFLIFSIAFGQPDTGSVILGIAPLHKTVQVKDHYPSIVLGVITQQASKIEGLNFVSRSPVVLEQIAKEKIIQTDADWLNSDVLAEVGKRLGATFLLTGDVAEVAIEKRPIPGKAVLGVPVVGKLVTIIINLNIVDVSTGKTVSKQVRSNFLPVVDPRGDEKIIADKIKNMGGQFRNFIQSWYNQKTGS